MEGREKCIAIFEKYLSNGCHCYQKLAQTYYKVGQFSLLQIKTKDISNRGQPLLLQIGSEL